MTEHLEETQAPEEEAQYWTKLGKEYEAAFGDDACLRQAVEQFLEPLPLDSQILEFGSGTGRPIAELVSDSGRHIHGIDIAPGMAEISRKQVPQGIFEVIDMLKFDPKIKYDGIIASLSIFELSRDEVSEMVGKWFQWLKPDGLLLIVTFAAEDCSKQVKSDTYDADGHCAQNVKWTFMGTIKLITLFTRLGWERLLKDAGLQIIHASNDLFIPAAEGCDPEPRHYIQAKKLRNPSTSE
ncbi:hypothetical protein ACLMJK_001693 [Lecanora helva]